MTLARARLWAIAVLPLGAVLWYGVNVAPPTTLDLDAIQANVLPGFDTTHQALVLVTFGTAAGARAWLAALTPSMMRGPGRLTRLSSIGSTRLRRSMSSRGMAESASSPWHRRRRGTIWSLCANR